MANKLSKKVLTLERPALGSYEPLLAPKPAPDSFSHPNDPVKELALDTITEFTTNNGVTVDGVILKDSGVKVTGVTSPTNSNVVAGFYRAAAQIDTPATVGGVIQFNQQVLTTYLTTINTGAGAQNLTLPNSTQVGQLIKILLLVDGGGNAVITPTSLSGGTTITMNDANDFVILIWNGTAWVCIENSGSTIA